VYNICYRKINEKAVLCNDREGETSDLNERIKSLNQEIFNYKWVIDEFVFKLNNQKW